MKTKLALFVAVFASVLLGVGCAQLKNSVIDSERKVAIPTVPTVVLSMEHTNSVYTVTWNPDGKQLAATGGDSTLKIWDGATGKAIKTIIGPVPELSTRWSPSVSWSPDGRKIVSNSNDPNGHLRVWDTTTGKLIYSIQAHSSYGLGGAWSPNGKHFGSSGGDRAVRIWNATTGKKELEMRHGHYAYCMAWSPDGTKIASGSYDKTLRVWSADTGKELNRFTGHTGVIRGFSWSPDGTKLASGGGEGRPTNDRSLRIWDLASNKLIYQIDDAHSRDVARVKWSPDGKKIASTGQDNVLRIRDAQTGKLLFEQKLSGQDISWHPDSRRLATIYGKAENNDRTISIWFIPEKMESVSIKPKAKQDR